MTHRLKILAIALLPLLVSCLGTTRTGFNDPPADTDDDGIIDAMDNCPLIPNQPQTDLDADNFGDDCDDDDDDDLVPDSTDNCPAIPNPSQADSDGDGVGNVCDLGDDSDGDGIGDLADNCPGIPNPSQVDSDSDGWGDLCETDDDNDLVNDLVDNCPLIFNPTQLDSDDDRVGDGCDTGLDTDGDGIEDVVDSCPLLQNPGQEDSDGDGRGDACDNQPAPGLGFPGDPVTAFNVSEDGLAFTNTDRRPTSLNVFWHGDDGTAIVAYWTYAISTMPAVPAYLRVHYFDGQSLSPAVDLTGPEAAENYQNISVLFLNTEGAADANARARDGDAIILWSQSDSTEANLRLYGTYFDVSQATSPSGTPASVEWGFETAGTLIDFDNQISGIDDSVLSFSFVSDSTVGSHGFNYRTLTADLPQALQSGQPTSFAWLAWVKGQREGAGTTPERLHALEFDLTAAGNGLPTQSVLGDGTVGVAELQSGQPVLPTVTAHDGYLLWFQDDAAGTGQGYATRLGAGTQTTTPTYAAGEPLSPHNVYGPDHNLAGLYAVGLGGGGLKALQLDTEAPLVAQSVALGNGAIVSFDGTRIARGSGWVAALWRQTEPGGELLNAAAIQTRLPSEAPRSLTQSTVALNGVPNQVSGNVLSVDWQQELATGTKDSRRNIQSNAARINWAFQQKSTTNPLLQLLLHNGILFTRSPDTNPPTASYTVTGSHPEGLVDENDSTYIPLGPNGDMLPAVSDLGTADGAPLIYYLRNENNPTDALAPDAFDEVRIFGTPGVAGGVPSLVSTTGLGDTYSLSDEAGGVDDFETGSDFLRVRTTPVNLDISTGLNHGGLQSHLFWMEPRGHRNAPLGLRTRFFRKGVFSTADATSFTQAHSPDLAAPPVRVDGDLGRVTYIAPTLHTEIDQFGPINEFTTTSGNRVGLYFRSRFHFYYQEFDGNQWLTDLGQPAPLIVDDYSGERLFPGRDQQAMVFSPRLFGTANTLNKTLLFYQKDEYAHRWYARVRD